MIFSKFIELYSDHNKPDLGHVHHPQISLMSNFGQSLFPPFSVSINLPFLNMSYKLNYPYSLLRLASFTYYNVFEVHPCVGVYSYFIPFYCLIELHYMDILYFIYLLSN